MRPSAATVDVRGRTTVTGAALAVDVAARRALVCAAADVDRQDALSLLWGGATSWFDGGSGGWDARGAGLEGGDVAPLFGHRR